MKLLTHERQWGGGETAVAFGMFDGVHRGHERLMRAANALAERDGLSSVVYTFSTHPMSVFAPERVPPVLHTREEKVSAIARLGVDAAVMRPFDAEYAAQSPEEFVRAMADALRPRHVVIGFNYSFGRKGEGKAADMVRLGQRYGFKTLVVDAVREGGEPVSSTRVRAAVEAGDMELAARLLGRPYALCGVIERGKQLGRQLGFPTANLPLPRGKVLPPRGVYAASADVNGETYMAAINIGRHPTAPGGGATVEANLLDYPGGELYGCGMRLRLLHQVREERRFESLDALREEVLRNREQVRAYFAGL